MDIDYGCTCCTCQKLELGDTISYTIDPACRNHGAHGMRECLTHRSAPVPCKYNDGCGFTLDKVIEGEH